MAYDTEKGKYYKIILTIMGFDENLRGGVTYLFSRQLQGIYESIPHYFKEPHVVDMEEFKYSMRYALADTFGGSCEVDEPDNMWDWIKEL